MDAELTPQTRKVLHFRFQQQSAEEESSNSHISTVVDEEWKKFKNKHFANRPAERGWRKIAAAKK